MNPDICKKCNKCEKLYYIKPLNVCFPINKDDYFDELMLQAFWQQNFLASMNNNNISEMQNKQEIHSLYINNKNFDEIIKELKVESNRCSYKAEHDLYDWNNK